MPRGRPRTNKSTLPPSYFESHGAVYHVVKNKWRPVGTAADAHAEYAERLRQGPEGQLNPLIDAEFTVMKSRTVDPLSKNTISSYTDAIKKLKHLLRRFAHPTQVKQKDAAMIKVLLTPTPNMANHVLSVGRQIFGNFVEQQLIDANPFLGVKRHKVAKRTRLIKQGEWDKVYTVASPRLKLVMDGLFLTDQRIDDVLNIDERDILDDGPGVYFKQQKTKKELIVAWNPQLREWIAACRALHPQHVIKVDFEAKNRPLFRTRHGRRPAYKTVYDEWVRAVAKTDVEDCNLHDNRAFSATELARQAGGGDVGEKAAQLALGHEDRRTTKIYLRGREVQIVHGPQMRRTG